MIEPMFLTCFEWNPCDHTVGWGAVTTPCELRAETFRTPMDTVQVYPPACFGCAQQDFHRCSEKEKKDQVDQERLSLSSACVS